VTIHTSRIEALNQKNVNKNNQSNESVQLSNGKTLMNRVQVLTNQLFPENKNTYSVKLFGETLLATPNGIKIRQLIRNLFLLVKEIYIQLEKEDEIETEKWGTWFKKV